MTNLALTEDATVSGNAPEGGRGIPTDILWNPSTNDWATESDWHEYGMAFYSMMAATEADPFNPKTTIQFDLPKQGHVTLCIYDILGKQVAMIMNNQLKAGQYKIQFNAKGLASGIYFYQIQMGEYRATKKMLLNR